jgi:hypothetical protein
MYEVFTLGKAELVTTTKCYGDCEYCYGQGVFGPEGTSVPIETLHSRAEKLRKFHEQKGIEKVVLMGGETLLHPNIQELCSSYGNDLPLCMMTAGKPSDDVNIEPLLDHITEWWITYKPHMRNNYLTLTDELLRADRKVHTVINYDDTVSLASVLSDFCKYGLRNLEPMSDKNLAGFVDRLSTGDDSLGEEMFSMNGLQVNGINMCIVLTPIDRRFTRQTGTTFQVPYHYKGPSKCHLYNGGDGVVRNLAILEDGRVVPCTTPSQRHVAPIIRNIDEIDEIPLDIAEHMDDVCSEMLFKGRYEKGCGMECSEAHEWAIA